MILNRHYNAKNVGEVMKKILSFILLFAVIICSNGLYNVSAAKVKKKVICIDAGHQTRANLEKEPIGPGAKTTKFKVTGGTSGLWTKQTEYALALKVAKSCRRFLRNAATRLLCAELRTMLILAIQKEQPLPMKPRLMHLSESMQTELQTNP